MSMKFSTVERRTLAVMHNGRVLEKLDVRYRPDAFEPAADQRGLYVPTSMASRTAGTAIGRKPQRVVTLVPAR